MRCPYCGTDNDEAVDHCRKCGEELPQARAQWSGSQGMPKESAPADVRAAFDQWDPAKRFNGPRPTSTYVPPARYPTHISWIFTIILVGLPATAIHVILFYRGVQYPHNLQIAVWAVMLCCLPLSVVSLLLASMVRAMHHAGKDSAAYRFSQTTGLLCWISIIAALALYVILFLRLMESVGDFWVY